MIKYAFSQTEIINSYGFFRILFLFCVQNFNTCIKYCLNKDYEEDKILNL